VALRGHPFDEFNEMGGHGGPPLQLLLQGPAMPHGLIAMRASVTRMRVAARIEPRTVPAIFE
jgi:hypothetical protein